MLKFNFLLLSLLQFGSITLGQDLNLVTEPLNHVEGPHWDDVNNVLYYVDIVSRLVVKYNPATNQRTQVFIADGDVSPVLTVEGSNDTFVVGRGRDIVSFQWDGLSAEPSNTKVLTTVETNKPKNKFNDGKADTLGRMWMGTIEEDGSSGNAGFFYFDRENNYSPVKKLNATTSNGLVWTANNSLLYYIDSPTMNVDLFDYDEETAEISNRRHFFSTADNNLNGVPDGMTMDSNGNLWIAVWGASVVINVNGTSGQLINKFDIPATQVSSCVWGGKNLDILYITTSRVGLSQEDLIKQPLAGAVFSLTNTGLRGQKSNKVRL